MNHEFQLIEQCFKHPYRHPLTQLGNGDDASVHAISNGDELVVSTDASVLGVHWPKDFPLDQAADRAVCAALSDLAAMGAKATWLWSTVFLQSPQQAKHFATGIHAACQRHQIEIAGGDTVHAPYPALNITVAGLVPKKQAMRRDTANIGDDIWLFGQTGHAALGLTHWIQHKRSSHFVKAFSHITPQLEQGILLQRMGVRCCIDISDGLMQDAQHIAKASDLQLQLHIEYLNLDLLQDDLTNKQQAIQLALSGGEDYGLLFSASPQLQQQLIQMHCQRIGTCVEGTGVHIFQQGQRQHFDVQGYDHFATVD